MKRRSRGLLLGRGRPGRRPISVLAGGATAAKHVTVAFVGADMLDPYYLTQQCGASAAAKANNATLTWQGVTGVDFAPEVTDVQRRRAEAPGCDRARARSATPRSSSQSRTRRSRGSPVVTDDAALHDPVELATVHTDNLILGRPRRRPDGEVPPAARARSQSSRSRPTCPCRGHRVNGFKNEVKKKYPGIEVVTVQYGGADAGKSAQLMSLDPDSEPRPRRRVRDRHERRRRRRLGDSGSRQARQGQADRLRRQPDGRPGPEVRRLRRARRPGPVLVGLQAVQLAAKAAQGLYKKGSDPFWTHTGGAVITRANVGSAAVRALPLQDELLGSSEGVGCTSGPLTLHSRRPTRDTASYP